MGVAPLARDNHRKLQYPGSARNPSAVFYTVHVKKKLVHRCRDAGEEKEKSLDIIFTVLEAGRRVERIISVPRLFSMVECVQRRKLGNSCDTIVDKILATVGNGLQGLLIAMRNLSRTEIVNWSFVAKCLYDLMERISEDGVEFGNRI